MRLERVASLNGLGAFLPLTNCIIRSGQAEAKASYHLSNELDKLLLLFDVWISCFDFPQVCHTANS